MSTYASVSTAEQDLQDTQKDEADKAARDEAAAAGTWQTRLYNSIISTQTASVSKHISDSIVGMCRTGYRQGLSEDAGGRQRHSEVRHTDEGGGARAWQGRQPGVLVLRGAVRQGPGAAGAGLLYSRAGVQRAEYVPDGALVHRRYFYYYRVRRRRLFQIPRGTKPFCLRNIGINNLVFETNYTTNIGTLLVMAVV
eukprot:COSAG05_NODE_5513_length_1155_cov_2.009470_2_plen_196_part_00